jgi:hypothetical protein
VQGIAAAITKSLDHFLTVDLSELVWIDLEEDAVEAFRGGYQAM